MKPDRFCDWCEEKLSPESRIDARFCSRKCRQAAWRLRNLSLVDPRNVVARGDRQERRVVQDLRDGSAPAAGDVSGGAGARLRIAYADPPYPGMAKRYYDREEVDHPSLIDRLTTDYDGWALSTSARALRDVLPLCPPQARVCAWVKPHYVPPATYGLHNVWEPLIVFQARRLRPGRADALIAYPARMGGTLPGRKPLAFCAWLFDCLGMLPGDELDDLFPGTGIVARSWRELSAGAASGDLSDTFVKSVVGRIPNTSRLEKRHVGAAGETANT